MRREQIKMNDAQYLLIFFVVAVLLITAILNKINFRGLKHYGLFVYRNITRKFNIPCFIKHRRNKRNRRYYDRYSYSDSNRTRH